MSKSADYIAGLKAAALIAERMRDAWYQRCRDQMEVSAIDAVRHIIQVEVDRLELEARS